MHQIVKTPADTSRRWWVLAIVVSAQFMFGVDAFIVNVAIPTIAAELHATPAQIEAVIAIYLIADVGSIGGGWLSSALIKRGATVNRARKTAMFICAMCVTPIVLVSRSSNLWATVALVGLAAAAHQGWSANMFTLASDMFPRRAVGSVVGMGGMAGAIGGMLIAVATGWFLQLTGSYVAIFWAVGSAYLVALAVIHWLIPDVRPAQLTGLEAKA